MVWFRVDDVLPFHQRVIEAGNAAMGLWVRAGAWSSGQLTDGYIPKTIARQIGTAAEIRRLVQTGLWIEEIDGYRFHAWAEDGTGAKRQPTRADVEAQRKGERERKAAYRAGRKDTHRDSSDLPDGVPAGVPVGQTPGQPEGHPPDVRRVSGHPDPTRPDPSTPDGVENPPNPRGKPRAVDPERFAEFWAIYPRPVDRPAAIRAWTRATSRAPIDEILAGAHRYANDPNRLDQFTKHPGPWLNADAWNNPPLPARNGTSNSSRESTLDRRDRQREQMFTDLAGLDDDPFGQKAIGS